MKIKTINGFFKFLTQRYVHEEKVKTWLFLEQKELTEEHYISPLLQNFTLEYSKYLSYEQVSKLVSHQVGNGTLSDQKIHQEVEKYAAKIQKKQEEAIDVFEQSGYKIETELVDIYDAEQEEILYFSDGVCVNEQKPIRDKNQKEGKERTTTNVMMLQKKDKKYSVLVAAKGIDEVKLVQQNVYTIYGNSNSPLPIVCISDGARCLKNQNKAIFGENVVHLLDWYHLQSKVIQLMSQIAPCKKTKEEHVNSITTKLWYGKTQEAILEIKSINAKNQQKQQELMGYLEKNEAHIIDYEKRKKAGKTIGSGRMEKQNDLIVAKRQKRKGMSWSPAGSRNMALLTTYHQYY